jgi:hypothetical protein
MPVVVDERCRLRDPGGGATNCASTAPSASRIPSSRTGTSAADVRTPIQISSQRAACIGV